MSPSLTAPRTADNRALEALVREHEPLVRQSLRRVLGRHRDEDDLVQEVFLRLAIRQHQPGTVVPAAWLRRVARNVAVDELRRRRPVPVDDQALDGALPPAPDHTGAQLEAHELRRILSQAVADLPERQRVALRHRLAEPGDSHGPSVADSPIGSATAHHSLLARARRQLRSQLAEQWPLAGFAGAAATVARRVVPSGPRRRLLSGIGQGAAIRTPRTVLRAGWRAVAVTGATAGLAVGAATWILPAAPIRPPRPAVAAPTPGPLRATARPSPVAVSWPTRLAADTDPPAGVPTARGGPVTTRTPAPGPSPAAGIGRLPVTFSGLRASTGSALRAAASPVTATLGAVGQAVATSTSSLTATATASTLGPTLAMVGASR